MIYIPLGIIFVFFVALWLQGFQDEVKKMQAFCAVVFVLSVACYGVGEVGGIEVLRTNFLADLAMGFVLSVLGFGLLGGPSPQRPRPRTGGAARLRTRPTHGPAAQVARRR
jgi:hypothetical protein